MSFKMYVPTRFVFGKGCLGELHQQELPGKRAMLAISNGKSVRENGALARTEEQLKHACDDRFIRMAQALGMAGASKPEDFITMLVKLQEDCGAANLKMSDYGFTPNEFDMLAVNARETMGGLFAANPCDMAHEDCVEIFKKSYR